MLINKKKVRLEIKICFWIKMFHGYRNFLDFQVMQKLYNQYKMSADYYISK